MFNKKLKNSILIVCLIGFFIFISYKIHIISKDNQLKMKDIYLQHQILLDVWLDSNKKIADINTDTLSIISELKLENNKIIKLLELQTQNIKTQSTKHQINVTKLKSENNKIVTLFKSQKTKIQATKNQIEVTILKSNICNLKSELVALQKKPTYDYLKSVTVRIFKEIYDNYGSIGTGSIIKITDDFTYILTNKHVAPIESKDDIYIIMGDKKIKAEVIKNSQFEDLSLIKVPVVLKNKTVINGISKSYPSDKVYSVGMYLGNSYIYTEGTFAGYQRNNILINAPASFGCSGSGVFNKDGKLIAVIFGTNNLKTFDTDSSKAICVSIEAVNLFLQGII